MPTQQINLKSGNKRISTAPMVDWSTKDFLTFARWFNPHIHLYTEMISTSAILHGDSDHHLRFYDNQHPLVLQLGGSMPDELAKCAKLGQDYGYDEINLNVGCPSDRVQHYKIGACLMKTPTLVADCVKAMQDSVQIPITVKHRIGIDDFDSYEFMRDFVGKVAESGCTHFIVHARIAWLNGLSPKENREIPPLRYEDVYRLKQEFKHLYIEINGGIKTLEAVKTHLMYVDGVMIGRESYHNPMFLGQLNELWNQKIPTHREIFAQLIEFLIQCEKNNTPLTTIIRHYLGLFQGLTGSRKWRQALSGKKSLTISQIEKAGESVLTTNHL
ncbi:tRNA-dihydrouridine synthase A [Moraxella macacae 0408225]|uniref:tRNA-dihydrouridine(20/20a) synthase n=2 Tax=Pseudomonadota TaxID=1224 RepID=L2F7L3_9GAMM|nr:tRNA dihydrouridine(20/20a) synthase DusA [Moraxella macacae]ELA08761.1 tRNA-dihydrouridine synthase A [Moraxella macacae 0408225]